MEYNYWLEIEDNFFSQLHIKKLRNMPGGDTFIIIYQKMLLLSAETNGYITSKGIEKTLEGEISLAINENTNNVKTAIKFMKVAGLIEPTTDKNGYLLKAVGLTIGSD